MFTPQEVSEKTFPKSSSFSSGYDLAAVDEFLDTLTEDYTALYKENAALKAKLKILAEKLEEYRATEDTMRTMLLAAQKMAASMTDEAKEKSEKMLAEARSQREQILEEAGWKAGSDGIREKDGVRASMTLMYPASDSVRQLFAAITRQQL